jgi:aminoglycoside 6'-N-acetyltransferase
MDRLPLVVDPAPGRPSWGAGALSDDDRVQVVVLSGEHELRGSVHPGESWAAAARRTCSSLHREPVPCDLSGVVKRFVIDHDTTVTVRAMTRGDLPDVARWRASAHVRRWWTDDGEQSLESVTDKYGPRIDGMTPIRMWVAEVNGRSIGFVQDYRVGDYPEFALLAPHPDAIGVDYAIGDAQWLGRGLGTQVLWAWALRTRRRLPDATAYFAAPDHRNEASLRMLDKVGFTRGVWFDEPRASGEVATMVGCTLDVRQVLG